MTNETEGRVHLSASQLKSATKCGERYYIERLHRPRLARQQAAWSIAGSAFHEALEDWEREYREGTIAERFEPIYDRMLDEAKAETPDMANWMKVPSKSFKQDWADYKKRFMEKDCPQYEARSREAEWEILVMPDDSLALEVPFELDVGNGLVVVGKVDRILNYPGKNTQAIEDTKSGSPDDDDDIRQLVTYREGILDNYGIDIAHGRYWYTKMNRPSAQWFDLSSYGLARLSEDYHKLQEIKEKNLLLPNPGKQCGMCGVRKYCRLLGWEELPTEEEDTPDF